MDYKCRISRVIERASRINLPLQDLCAAARVNKSTFYRWQRDDANPRMRSMLRALDAMEAELSERERRLVAALAGSEAA